MKKVIMMVVAAMMATVNVSAQDETKHEIGVFYGMDSASDIVSYFTSGFSAAMGDQSSFFGPLGFEYYYHVTPVVGVGGVFAYTQCKAVDKKTGNNDLSEKFITVMPSVKLNWLRKKYFGMYSAASLGVMVANISGDADDETKAFAMFQATALGLEFGGNVRGFVEAGVGEKGLLCAGLRYRF